jgi:2-polyprenyl-6-methoxyphenol hydroxylase-like FAD-dependent oxidoreductase
VACDRHDDRGVVGVARDLHSGERISISSQYLVSCDGARSAVRHGMGAEEIAQGKGVVIPDEIKASSAAMSAWIDSNRGTKRRKRGRKIGYKPAGSVTPQSTAPTKRSRKRKTYGE